MLSEEKYKGIYNPKSNRLQNYDYSSNGAYFITICTKNRENYFGEIINGEMFLNDIGKIIKKFYLEIKEHFPFVILDEFVIMPNHIHGIIIINNPVETTIYRVSNDIKKDTINGCLYEKGGSLIKNQNVMLNKNHIGFIIRKLKGKSTFFINKFHVEQIKNISNISVFAWQKNYYYRIIRNENELKKIRKYIYVKTCKQYLQVFLIKLSFTKKL